MQAVLNGTITNDKFCLSRLRQIQWMPVRPAGEKKVQYPFETNMTNGFSQEDTDETTAMDCSTFHHLDNRRSTSLESSVPVITAMERGTSRSKNQWFQSPGGQE